MRKCSACDVRGKLPNSKRGRLREGVFIKVKAAFAFRPLFLFFSRSCKRKDAASSKPGQGNLTAALSFEKRRDGLIGTHNSQSTARAVSCCELSCQFAEKEKKALIQHTADSYDECVCECVCVCVSVCTAFAVC